MKNKPLLQLNNVFVELDGALILQDVSISIDQGEIVSLIGPNGSGKSTILRTIFGLNDIKSGEILWNNEKISPSPKNMLERKIVYVPQGKQIFPDLTVQENLEIGGYSLKDIKIINQEVARVIRLFPELSRKKNEKASSLSGGQQQLLTIARALMLEPRMLLLDEPSLGLSPKTGNEIFTMIEKLNKEHNTTILIVEHNIRSLLKISTRSYILDKGKIIKKISSRDINEKELLKKIL